MKSLKSFIYESINPQLKSVSIKLVDRSFKESISDEDFVKFLKQDIDKCFNIPDSELNEDYDKVIERLIQSEIDRKYKNLEDIASRKYKQQSRREEYIRITKNEIEEQIRRIHPRKTIEEIQTILNPISWGQSPTVTKNKKSVRNNVFYWDDKTLKILLEDFNRFSVIDSDGKERSLRDGVAGWEIRYGAYESTNCPINGVASLVLKLNKQTEKEVIAINKSHGNAMDRFYGPNGNYE